MTIMNTICGYKDEARITRCSAAHLIITNIISDSRNTTFQHHQLMKSVMCAILLAYHNSYCIITNTYI